MCVRSSFVTLCTFHGTIVNLNITKWMYKFLFSSQVSSTYLCCVCVRALFYLSKTHHRFFTFASSTEHLRSDGKKNYVSANCYFSRTTITAPRIEREYKMLDATKIRNIIAVLKCLIENSFGRFRAECVSIASNIIKSSNNKIDEDDEQQQQENFLCDFLRSFA